MLLRMARGYGKMRKGDTNNSKDECSLALRSPRLACRLEVNEQGVE